MDRDYHNHKYPSPPDDTTSQKDDRESQDRRRAEEYSTGEANGRRPAPPTLNLPPMSSNVTLPGIQGLYPNYPPPPGQGTAAGPVHPPLGDPRAGSSNNYAASPTTAGYGAPPPPPHGPPPPGYPVVGHAPPPGHPAHVQHPSHPPPPHVAHGGHPGVAPPPHPGQHPHAPPPPPYDYYAAQRGQYPPPPPGYPYYPPPPGYPYGAEYAQMGMAQQQQIAPRQRTSIACRYCRKRKIRCSGYQNTQNGKCTNCDKLRIDCVFQPVSSGSGTAFIPVSAVPGGVPPGTPLYGAYGQPLPPAGQAGQQQPPPGPYGPLQGNNNHQQQVGSYPPPHHQQSQPSPTSQYPPPQPHPQSQGESRPDDRTYKARRHPREDDEEDPNARLPPPHPYGAGYEPARRRSPASADGTPPAIYHYQHSTRSFETDRTPTPRRNSGGYSPTNANGRPTSAVYSDAPPPGQQHHSPYPNGLPDRGVYPSPKGNHGRPSPRGESLPSPNYPGYPPPNQAQPQGQAGNNSPNAPGQSHIMSLNNLLGRGPPPQDGNTKGSDIDNSMLGKLNKRPKRDA